MYFIRLLNKSGVFPPIFMGSDRRIRAAVFSFIAVVMLRMPMLGR